MCDGDGPLIYADVLQQLERAGVRYVVIGSVALVLHGYERPAPADLDIVVDRSPLEAERAMSALLAACFVPTIPLPLSHVRVLTFNDHTHRTIDVFARSFVPFEQLLANSELVRVDDALIRIASVADLTLIKESTGRPGDARDVEELRAAAKRTDSA
jgi:predicted nucleotidyltransferase